MSEANSTESSSSETTNSQNEASGQEDGEEEEEEEEVDDEAKDEDSKRNEPEPNCQHEPAVSHRTPNVSSDQAGIPHEQMLQQQPPVVVSGAISDSLVNIDNLEEQNEDFEAHKDEPAIDLAAPPLSTSFDPYSSSCLPLDHTESTQLITEIVDFVIADDDTSVSIGDLRTSLLNQIDRAQKRLRGIKDMTELLRSTELIPSVKYNLLNGWLGIINYCSSETAAMFGASKGCLTPLPQCEENIELIPPYHR